jgi:two-component system chemotaxis response regulator CheB
VEGLQRGAFDFIRKPDGPDETANAALLRRQLFEKIDLFARSRGRLSGASVRQSAPLRGLPIDRTGRFHAVAIGASTGGPEALARLLPVLTKKASVPVFIVQHMPPGMTRYFADSLGRKCDYRVVEAADGEAVQPRTAYISPGGRHMIVRRHEGRIVTALNDQPPENGCRPSVDVLFRSAAAAYPQAVVAVILTGMGCDGVKGLGPLRRSGAYVIAQDEATSVVWGMPGAAAASNQVDEILPLERIGPTLASLLGAGTIPCI